MGRNKKSHKQRKVKRPHNNNVNERVKQPPKINVKLYILSSFICLIFYVILVLICGILGLGSKWDMWKTGGNYILLITTLFFYRLVEYTVPALILKAVLKKTWAGSFHYQFAGYAFMNALVFIFGIDYAFDIELFSLADSFTIIIGYLISFITKKDETLDNVAKIVEETK